MINKRFSSMSLLALSAAIYCMFLHGGILAENSNFKVNFQTGRMRCDSNFKVLITNHDPVKYGWLNTAVVFLGQQFSFADNVSAHQQIYIPNHVLEGGNTFTVAYLGATVYGPVSYYHFKDFQFDLKASGTQFMLMTEYPATGLKIQATVTLVYSGIVLFDHVIGVPDFSGFLVVNVKHTAKETHTVRVSFDTDSCSTNRAVTVFYAPTLLSKVLPAGNVPLPTYDNKTYKFYYTLTKGSDVRFIIQSIKPDFAIERITDLFLIMVRLTIQQAGSEMSVQLRAYNSLGSQSYIYPFLDFNECENNASICGNTKVCVNTNGAHSCPCQPGYIEDKTYSDTCLPALATEPSLTNTTVETTTIKSETTTVAATLPATTMTNVPSTSPLNKIVGSTDLKVKYLCNTTDWCFFAVEVHGYENPICQYAFYYDEGPLGIFDCIGHSCNKTEFFFQVKYNGKKVSIQCYNDVLAKINETVTINIETKVAVSMSKTLMTDNLYIVFKTFKNVFTQPVAKISYVGINNDDFKATTIRLTCAENKCMIPQVLVDKRGYYTTDILLQSEYSFLKLSYSIILITTTSSSEESLGVNLFDPSYNITFDIFVPPLEEEESYDYIWNVISDTFHYEWREKSFVYKFPHQKQCYLVALQLFRGTELIAKSELNICATLIDCFKPELKLTGLGLTVETPFTNRKSQIYKIESETISKCPAFSIFKASWEIYSGKYFTEKVKSTDIQKEDVTTLILFPNALPYGLYKICMTSIMTIDTRFQETKCGYLRVIPSNLFVDVLGGTSVVRSIDYDYIVDAHRSMDPDTGNLDGVSLYFLCRQITDPKFVLSLYEAVKDIKYIGPLSFTNKKGGCYGNGPGRINLALNQKRVVLSTREMVIGVFYEITVFLWKPYPIETPRIGYFKQNATVIVGPVPEVTFQCIENCNKYVNYNQIHSIAGECTIKEKCGGKIQWDWLLMKCDNEDAENCMEVPSEIFDKIRNTDRNLAYYSVDAYGYEHSTWYKLCFRGYRTPQVYGESGSMFYVNKPPENGTCDISPTTGTVLIDEYHIFCSGWLDEADHLPLYYSFYSYDKQLKQIFYNGLMNNLSIFLPLGDEEDDFNFTVYIDISDRFGSTKNIKKTVKVNKPVEISKILLNLTASINSNDSMLQASAHSNDMTKALNIGRLFSSVINSYSKGRENINTTNITKSERQKYNDDSKNLVKLREALFNVFVNMPAKSTNEVILLSGTLSMVAAQPSEISSKTQSTLLNKSNEFIDIIKSDSLDTESAKTAVAGVLTVMGKVLQVSGSLADVHNSDDIKNDAVKSLHKGNVSIEQQAKEQVNKTDRMLRMVQKIINQKSLPGGEPVAVETELVSISSSKVLFSNKSKTLGSGSVSANINMAMFPSPNLTDDAQMSQAYTSIDIKRILHNPYTSDNSSSRVKSQLTGIDVSSHSGDTIDVNNTAEPIEIIVQNKLADLIITNASMEEKENNEQWLFNKLNFDKNSFRAVIKPENSSYIIDVYLRNKKRPTVEKFDFKWTLPDNSSCKWLNSSRADEPIDLIAGNHSDYICTHEIYSVFVSDKEDLDGVFYLAVRYKPPVIEVQNAETEDNVITSKERRRREINLDKVDSDFCVAILPPPPTPAPTDPPGSWEIVTPKPSNDSVQLQLSTSFAKCLFWDSATETWSSNGCYVGPDTTLEKTQCLCSHLTDFGGDVLVAPNPIDFDQVFAGLNNLGDNLGVLMVILTIVLLYVLLLIWARKKDRRDEEQKGPVVIDCTKAGQERYTYIVTIVTGAGMNAGTTANVYCVISGMYGDSRVIPLVASENKKIFASRTLTTFKIILPLNLGELSCIRIFHDNSGKSPSWYLRNVIVTDLQMKSQAPFVCDQWLAVDSVDGQIERLLYIANEKELASFQLVFAVNTAKGLLDGHIWLSVFTRPQQSAFTRVQRLSCCLSLIFLTMITNAMFFGVGDAPGSKKIIRLGNMIIDLTGIIIGIESSVIVIPPSVVIIEIFRRLKPKKLSAKEKKALASDEEIFEMDVKVENDCTEDKTGKKEKQPFMFPYQFRYVAYTLVLLSSFSSALFTFFYSMMWGPKKSNRWLASMFAGFFQSLFVIQPIKAVLVAMILAILIKNPVKQEHEEEEEEEEEEKEKLNKTTEKSDIERCESCDDVDGDDDLISADEIPIIRPTESALEQARKLKLKEKMTWAVMKDIATYFIFLIIVTNLAYAEKDPNMFNFRRDLQNLFSEGTYMFGLPLSLVSNSKLVYSWLRDTVMPGMFGGPWYNDRLVEEDGFVESRESFVISIPRLRQHRVSSHSCEIPEEMKHLIHHCESEYSFSTEDKKSYGTGWVKLNQTNSRSRRDTLWVVENKNPIVSPRRRKRSTDDSYQPMATGKTGSLRRRKAKKTTNTGEEIYYVTPEALLPDGTVVSCKERWEHFSATQLRGFPFFGRLVTYSGGGYVANLGYNEETGWTVLADLHAHDWLDRHTRALFVEFTVYNANINLFATAFLFIETLPTGGAFPYSEFKVFNGYRYALNSNLSSRLCELLFLCFIVYFGVREIKKIRKQKMGYFKSFFNIIEVILVPLYIMLFGLIIFRWLSTAQNIRRFKENPKDFVSFQYSAEADSALQSVMGVVVFLLNIKFLKLFQFSKSFYGVGVIMKSFFAPLVNFCLAFGLYFFLFAAVSHLGFGRHSENYYTYVRALVSQFLHLLGTTDFENVRMSHRIFGPTYYIAFSLFMFMVMFNLFLAIICEAIDGDYEEEILAKIGEIDIAGTLLNFIKSSLGYEVDASVGIEEEDDDGSKKMDEEVKKLEHAVDELLSRVTDLGDQDELEYKALKSYEIFEGVIIETSDEEVSKKDELTVNTYVPYMMSSVRSLNFSTSLNDNNTLMNDDGSREELKTKDDRDGRLSGSDDTFLEPPHTDSVTSFHM